MAEKTISSTMAKIIDIRKKLGITQQTFAEMNGWKNKASVLNYEYGMTQPSIVAVESMLEKLGYCIEVRPINSKEEPKPEPVTANTKPTTVQLVLTMESTNKALEVLSTINREDVQAEIYETTKL